MTNRKDYSWSAGGNGLCTRLRTLWRQRGLMLFAILVGSTWRSLMLRITLVLLVFVLLSNAGCNRDLVVPHPAIPHRVSRPTVVYIVVEGANGPVEKRMKIPAGWWVASPLVVEEIPNDR